MTEKILNEYVKVTNTINSIVTKINKYKHEISSVIESAPALEQEKKMKDFENMIIKIKNDPKITGQYRKLKIKENWKLGVHVQGWRMILAISLMVSSILITSTMKKLLWLDDKRNPQESDWLSYSPIENPYEVIWVKKYHEFVTWITENGLPDAICFDHDLSDIHCNKSTYKEKTGKDCANWLVEYCLDNKLALPLYIFNHQIPLVEIT